MFCQEHLQKRLYYLLVNGHVGGIAAEKVKDPTKNLSQFSIGVLLISALAQKTR